MGEHVRGLRAQAPPVLQGGVLKAASGATRPSKSLVGQREKEIPKWEESLSDADVAQTNF